jgi:hypothetical protein
VITAACGHTPRPKLGLQPGTLRSRMRKLGIVRVDAAGS